MPGNSVFTTFNLIVNRLEIISKNTVKNVSDEQCNDLTVNSLNLI